ncbi:MAG: YihY family inner membrane protein [Pedosphaera sp.]|nr:YihY family inner membrane protein [Pedosphaera sp.]
MADQSLSKLNRFRAEALSLLDGNEPDTESYQRLPRWRHVAYFCVRVLHGFNRNRCSTRAAALTFTTVLALVPILAVMLSISTAFAQKDSANLRKLVTDTIETTAPQLKEIEGVTKVIDLIFSSIENFKSGSLGVTAVLALIFVAISLLSSIETTLNDIWGVSRGRTWAARVVHYWAAITLGPMLLLAAAGVATSSQLPVFRHMLEVLSTEYRMGFVADVLNFGTSYFLPFLILSGALTAMYALLPNTKVQWQAALAGALVAGALVQLNSTSNILYASRVTRDKSIYGGLAALPLFLVGLYLSWTIVLLGAQVAYAFQNRRAYIQDRRADLINQRGREFIALRLMALIGHAHQTGAKPPTASQMAQNLGLPPRLTSELLSAFAGASLTLETNGTEHGFAPARPLSQITVHEILQSLRRGQGREPVTSADNFREALRTEYEKVAEAERQIGASITLEALVRRASETSSVA